MRVYTGSREELGEFQALLLIKKLGKLSPAGKRRLETLTKILQKEV